MITTAPPAGFPASRAAFSNAEPGAGTLSGVSWGAIFAGAAGAAALSLVLLILGTGLGLSSVSPWAGYGASAAALGASAIAWLAFTQIAASGMGGYLAGRLRSKWAAVHSDEVYFRDTAHGFLAWAVATLLTAALLTSVIGSIVGTGVQAGAAIGGGVAAAATTAATTVAGGAGAAAGKADAAVGSGMGMGYFVDVLFRKDPAAPLATAAAPMAAAASPAAPSAEVAQIFINGLRNAALPPDDSRHLAGLVAQHTGMAQADAEKRVADTFNTMQAKLKDAEVAARNAANTARKASAGAALWLFVSLLAGAFVASWAATFGGRRRDI